MAKQTLNNKLGKSIITRIVVYALCALLVLYTSALLLSLFWGLITSLKDVNVWKSTHADKVGLPVLDPNNPYNDIEAFTKLVNYDTYFKIFYTHTEKFYVGSTLNSDYPKFLVMEVKQVPFFGMMLNTIMYTIGGAMIQAIMPCLAAYLCAKYSDFKLSGIMCTVYMFMMCMPIVGNYPTELTFLRNVGIYNDILGNYLQKMTGGGMYFFIYLAYFKGVSNTYREAAEIDGASQLTIMVRIYFPLAIKMVATVFLIQFVNLWNDYQTPLLYLPSFPTLAYIIYALSAQDFNRFSSEGQRLSAFEAPTMMAGCMLLAIPITIVFVFFKDKLMGDISLGGIKE
jgi:ABC-type glycerol-3-phosphate transport system permease component